MDLSKLSIEKLEQELVRRRPTIKDCNDNIIEVGIDRDDNTMYVDTIWLDEKNALKLARTITTYLEEFENEEG